MQSTGHTNVIKNKKIKMNLFPIKIQLAMMDMPELEKKERESPIWC